MATEHDLQESPCFKATSLGRGRALYMGQRGEMYVSDRYHVRRSNDNGKTWQTDCVVPSWGWKSWMASVRAGARLLRHYIAVFRVLPDGSRIAVARDGVYRAEQGATTMTQTFPILRGSRPLNLAVDGNRLLFGEYGNLNTYGVRIYVSEDGGRTFEVGYEFARGDMRHIHNVLVDPYENHYWVMAGDFDCQPGIAALSKDLKTLEWVRRGSQEYRCMSAINLPGHLLYGTDSDRARNFIVAMEKRSGRLERLIEIEGSSQFSSTFGSVHVISTCVEPNPYCPSQECSLYASVDDHNWRRFFVHRKDRWNPTLFQFGTIVLPYSNSPTPCGLCSGQAIQGANDVAFRLDWMGETS